ncbi:MAG TPA: HEAT repeat domain-containing protein [Kofleriaceae bacterium]|jgi:hypothetical protein
MTRSVRTVGLGQRVVGRVAAITLLALMMVAGLERFARADNIDTLINDLSDSSDRIRLSAVLNLTKQGDPRGIEPLINTLGNDSDKKVRSAAAVGLGIIVDAKTKKDLKAKAVAALQKAKAGDAAVLVQAQAEKSLGQIGATPSGGDKPKPSGNVQYYVNVGPMSSKTGNAAADPKLQKLMNKVATGALGKVTPTMQTTWSGNPPTAAQLQQKGFAGFYVDGTLNELKSTVSGGTATVSCKVSMLLASFPEKSVFGFLNGGAKVQGGTSTSDIDGAGQDCVEAVIEDLITKKIVPTIKDKAANP